MTRLHPPGTHLMALLAALAAAGCNSKEPDPSLALHIAQGEISVDDASLAAFPGLVGVANIDDDDEDGVADWGDAAVAADNDYSLLDLELQLHAVELTLGGDASQVRVWRDGALLLGGSGLSTATIRAIESTVTLEVEFSGLNTRNTLTVAELPSDDDDDDTVLASYELALTGAPLIVKHHLMPATGAFAMSSTYNREFIAGYEDALGDRFTGFNGRDYQLDPWLQDEFEFAALDAPDAYMDWIIDSIRNGQGNPGAGLDDLAEDHWLAPDTVVVDAAEGRVRATSFDYFGNLETSPPTTVNGVYYPFGRIYWGAEGRSSPDEQLGELLAAQQLQAPFQYTTAWLTVGHIDEFISTIPDPSSELGWKLVVSDVPSAWEVLEAMDPDLELVRWDGSVSRYEGHGIDTVGEILDDVAIRALNEELQRDYLDPAIETFKAELGITEDDIIRMPSLFEETGFGGVAALIPGMANLIVVNVEGETPLLFMADPFLRSSLNDQDSDAMIAHVRGLMPEGVEAVFLDDWFNYHMNLGEVHCGSKVQRTINEDWWTAGAHLLVEAQ